MTNYIETKKKKDEKVRKCFILKQSNFKKLKVLAKSDNRSCSSFLDNFIEHYEGEKNGRKNENN